MKERHMVRERIRAFKGDQAPKVIKLFLNAHKYKNINSAFLGSDKPRMLFLPLTTVKMPKTVGIYEQEKFHAQLSCARKKLYNLWARCPLRSLPVLGAVSSVSTLFALKSLSQKLMVIRAQGYKTFFILNSAEHDISKAQKYKNIKKSSIFQAQISLECYFSCP